MTEQERQIEELRIGLDAYRGLVNYLMVRAHPGDPAGVDRALAQAWACIEVGRFKLAQRAAHDLEVRP